VTAIEQPLGSAACVGVGETTNNPPAARAKAATALAMILWCDM
jgi:hypothetical protein